MKSILRLEEAAQFVLAVYLALQLPFPGWLYAGLFLAPDIGMMGYLINTKVGAVTYNLFHHKGLAILLYVSGIYATSSVMMFAGLILFGHSAFDRMLGYGLKFSDNFKNTHLGWIGTNTK